MKRNVAERTSSKLHPYSSYATEIHAYKPKNAIHQFEIRKGCKSCLNGENPSTLQSDHISFWGTARQPLWETRACIELCMTAFRHTRTHTTAMLTRPTSCYAEMFCIS